MIHGDWQEVLIITVFIIVCGVLFGGDPDLMDKINETIGCEVQP